MMRCRLIGRNVDATSCINTTSADLSDPPIPLRTPEGSVADSKCSVDGKGDRNGHR
jgi:hypothetical protein